MFFTASKILVWFVYPLSISFFLLITALVLSYLRKRRLFYTFLFSGIIILYVFSIRPTADLLLCPLERKYIENEKDISVADAIVVLSGSGGIKRIIKGVILFNKMAAPLIIMSGGSGKLFDQSSKDALSMKEAAIKLGVPDAEIIAETESRNTRENALYTKKVLKKINAQKIILVTSAFHMPRAYAVFKKIGVDVVPITSDFIVGHTPYDPFSFMPNAEDLRHTTHAVKEYVGIIVYWIRGWL